MLKYLYCIFILMLMPVFASAGEDPISLYKDNYFLFGNKEDQVKFQISVEYMIFNKFETDWVRNFYVAYTQASWWRVYKSADTMSNNYQPELFYRLELNKDSFKDKDSGMIDYIQISPLYHTSTGTEGTGHRGFNAYYAQIQASSGKAHNFGLNLKLFGYWCIHPNNRDINRYRDNYESDLFYKFRREKDAIFNKYEFHLRNTGNPFGRGYHIMEGSSQLHIAKKFQPKIFLQYCSGYGVNMVEYNIKKREFRIGIIYSR